MENLLVEAQKVVRVAEASLGELMQTAVLQGQYDRVAVLARCAEQLSQIAVGITAAPAPPESAPGAGSTPSNGTSRRTSAQKKAMRRKSKYPIFKRSGNNLVKVGWSKTSKSEYQHQAPKSVIFALVEGMAATKGHALITMDSVLPLATDEQPEVPAYQSYACLAWLREIGVVEQHGRQGYSVQPAKDAKWSIENAWRELATHCL